MVKCALITKSKFIKYVHENQPRQIFTVAKFSRPEYLTTEQLQATDNLDEKLNIDRFNFVLDRTYVNEYEEEVAVYYEI